MREAYLSLSLKFVVSAEVERGSMQSRQNTCVALTCEHWLLMYFCIHIYIYIDKEAVTVYVGAGTHVQRRVQIFSLVIYGLV